MSLALVMVTQGEQSRDEGVRLCNDQSIRVKDQLRENQGQLNTEEEHVLEKEN